MSVTNLVSAFAVFAMLFAMSQMYWPSSHIVVRLACCIGLTLSTLGCWYFTDKLCRMLISLKVMGWNGYVNGSVQIAEIQRKRIIFSNGKTIGASIKQWYDFGFFIVFFVLSSAVIAGFFKAFRISRPAGPRNRIGG
jgi:hypothetical protein